MAEVSIGDVILIFISAFGGAWANSRFRGREAKKAEKEERNSLVFLIDTEVGFNVMRLGGASKGPPSNVIPHLRTDFWDASQARLAHLLPTGDMKVLAPYYEQIRMLKELDDIAAKDDPRQLSDSEWTPMQGTQDRGFAVSQMAQGYVQDLEYRNLADVIATLRNGTGGPAVR